MADKCERRVRGFAGLVVTVGGMLGLIGPSIFFVFPALIGLSLLQSSVTGVCPIEFVLSDCTPRPY